MNNQKGFVPLLVIVIALVVIVLAGTGAILHKQGKLAPLVVSISQTFSKISDQAAPVISEINIFDITTKNARVSWNTDEVTKTVFYLGTDNTYNLLQKSFDKWEKSHEIKVTSLQSGEPLQLGTTYHFKIEAIDRAGNKSVPQDQAFATLEEIRREIVPERLREKSESEPLEVEVKIAPPENCSTGEWTNNICGGETCEATLMHQIRAVTPAGCVTENRCIEDPICATPPVVTATKVTYEIVESGTVTDSYKERRRLVIGGVVFQDEVVEVFYPIGFVTLQNTGETSEIFTLQFTFYALDRQTAAMFGHPDYKFEDYLAAEDQDSYLDKLDWDRLDWGKIRFRADKYDGEEKLTLKSGET
ncbi:MAG: hypothetical protein Q8N69_03115, partial [bacterium]|nr:hypothetical protein [bacterium]